MTQVVAKTVLNSLRDSRVVLGLVDLITFVGAGLGVLLSSHHRSYISEYFSSENVHYDVQYTAKGLSRHYLDIYPQKSTSPTIIFIHGGAWGTGRKSMYRLVGRRLQREGFCVFVMNYRIWPDAVAQTQAVDVISAINWVSKNATQYQGDPARIYLMGHSSGAHIATLATLTIAQQIAHKKLASNVLRHTDERKGEESFNAMPVAGVIGMSGVYDIGTHYRFEAGRGVHNISPMKPSTGSWAGWDGISPTLSVPLLSRPVQALLPKFLLLHGEPDGTVPSSSSEDFLRALKHSKVPSEGYKLVGVDHVTIHTDLMFDLPGGDCVMKLVHRFCEEPLETSECCDEMKTLQVLVSKL